jgi:cysteine desulfurase / selenocysteine lyase
MIRTLAELRADLPILETFLYLQTGSYAPVPQATQRYMADLMADESARVLALGSKGTGSRYEQRAEGARETLARLLGVQPDEVAWSYNTTTATRLAVRSFDWKSGDKLALTDVEHASTFDMARGMAQSLGVDTTVIPVRREPAGASRDVLAEVDRLLTADHRLLIVSHVANIDGRRLPVAEIVKLARDRGVSTLIDGAQAVGVFPVDAGDIGADFYSGSAHKWLMGPPGVGFLVVSRERLARYNPNFVPSRSDETPLAAGARSELGTPNNVLRLGCAYSIELLGQIGWDRIEGQMRDLTARLRTGLHAIHDVRVAGPEAWTESSGITTIQLEGDSPERCQRLVALLREECHIITKFRPELGGVRISIAAFNTEGDVDRLLAALEHLVPSS